jgi:hypothetical protein
MNNGVTVLPLVRARARSAVSTRGHPLSTALGDVLFSGIVSDDLVETSRLSILGGPQNPSEPLGVLTL